MRLAFTLEYDGTNFSGFQKQNNAITIQEHIENALKNITGSEIKINYSGRTDAGVHALSQVFDFDTAEGSSLVTTNYDIYHNVIGFRLVRTTIRLSLIHI